MGMATKIKKNRKMRGMVSSGKGRVGKHRKHPSGRGKTGGQHHHKNLFSKKYSLFFGKKGMRFFNLNKNKYSSKVLPSVAFLNIINLNHFKKTKTLGVSDYRIKNLVVILKKYTKNCIISILKTKNICFTTMD